MSYTIESMAKMRDDILKELGPGEEIPETELRARVEKRVDFETELFGYALWSLLRTKHLAIRKEGECAIICSFEK
jgi:hypothetical protein